MGGLETTEDWFNNYGESVFRRCRRILGDESSAWDVTQEVFVRAHRYRERFRGEGSVLSWLLTIADRRCFTWLRKRRIDLERLDALSLDPGQLDSSADLEAVLATAELVRVLLTRFDEDVQQIIVMRFFDELGQEEIARRLRISRKTVQRKLDRFFESARKVLLGWGEQGYGGPQP